MAEKKVFAWDSKVVIGEIEVSNYGKLGVAITALGEKEFVCITTHKKIRGEWRIVKNTTVPKEIWGDIVDLVSDFDLKNAFGSTTELSAVKKEVPAPKKKAPAASKKAPAAKKEAQKNEPVATMQGVKLGLPDRIARNENWKHLTKSQQTKLVNEVLAAHDEYGMVLIGITKTKYALIVGRGKMTAEKELRALTGFSRAQITFLA